VACSLCGQDLLPGQQVGDREVLDIDGTLDYFELFHRDCDLARSWDAVLDQHEDA
jgi:hypothetical protein